MDFHLYNLSEIAELFQIDDGFEDVEISNIAFDHREIKNGGLFIALKGEQMDGHDFIPSAYENGAVSVIGTQDKNPSYKNYFKVDDAFLALKKIAQFSRQRSQAKVIGVTGSVGKTSIKEALKFLLSRQAQTHASEKSYNNHTGVPLSLARLPLAAEFAVFEMGMNHTGEILELTKQVQPHVALITCIGEAHLQFFPSQVDVADAKAEIFEGVLSGGMAILNHNDAFFDRLSQKAQGHHLTVKSFGLSEKADAFVIHAESGEQGSQVVASINGHKIEYQLSIIGEHWVLNSLAILLAIDLVGGDVQKAATDFALFQPFDQRGVQKTIAFGEGVIRIIDDSYNANPTSVRASLKSLGHFQGKRKVAILGDMRELGESGPDLHASLMKDIMENDIDFVVTVGDLMHNLSQALPQEKRCLHVKTSQEVAKPLFSFLKNEDVLLVKGSKSMSMWTVIDNLTQLLNA